MTVRALPTFRDLKDDVITFRDLPEPGVRHWTPNRKYVIVMAVRHNMVSLETVLARYRMSIDEFSQWRRNLERHGRQGLLANRRARGASAS